jgi:cation diffusion facilitator family transporter
VILTAVTMVIEIIAGLLTGSMALLADGIHMGSHVLAIGLSWAAYVLVQKLSANPSFTASREKILTLSGYTSGLILLIFAGMIIAGAVGRFINPRVIEYREAIIIAFIGLGVMGYPMAGHLARAGHSVTVYNRSSAKAAAWVGEFGGAHKPTPREAAAGADIVFACVGNDDDLRSITMGADGAFAGCRDIAGVVAGCQGTALGGRDVCCPSGACTGDRRSHRGAGGG